MVPRRNGKGPIVIEEELFQNDRVHLCEVEMGHLIAAIYHALAVRQNYYKFEKRRLTLVRGFALKF
jgi:hypothetical protein